MPWPLMSCGKPTTAASATFALRDQRALDLGGADAVAGDVDHVVDAAGDPVVAVLVAAAAVAGEVLAGIGREVGLDEALVVAVDGAHLARPGIDRGRDCRWPRPRSSLPSASTMTRLHAEERLGRRAGLQLGGAGQRRDQDAAGLGLPPGVDDRAAAVADHVVVPVPGLGIDRLADRAEQAQRLARGRFFTGASPSRISARIAVGAV